MKILVLKPSSLGDVVHALPVLRLLKAHEPRHEIYWWLSRDLLALLEGDPDLSGIFPFERKRWGHPRYWYELLESIRQMRRHRFDWVIDLQGLARSGLIAWLARGRLTVGVEDWREGALGFYDLRVPRPTPLTHAVDWYLEVAKFLGVPIHSNFEWLPVRAQAAESVQRKWRPAEAQWIAINPGARWANKRWPVEFYAELVRRAGAEHPEWRFVILGGPGDAKLGNTIARAAPEYCVDVTGKTTLPELIEWIRRCSLVVTNDTGPMHIAAALGKPVIPIFGPTEPRRTGPYGQIGKALRVALPCAPCLRPSCHYEKPLECLRAISPALVWQEIEARI